MRGRPKAMQKMFEENWVKKAMETIDEAFTSGEIFAAMRRALKTKEYGDTHAVEALAIEATNRLRAEYEKTIKAKNPSPKLKRPRAAKG